MSRWIAAAMALLLVPALLIGALTAALTPSPGGGGLGGWAGLPEAFEDIPADMLALYRQAAARFGIPAQVLAAVGKVECDHNRNPACNRPNAAGAEGPMQFLPATFAAYRWAAVTADPSPYHTADAVFAAAAYLAASGLPQDPAAAVFAYNHADWYVAQVVAWALAYGWAPADTALLAQAVGGHPNLDLRPAAAGDVAAGRVDARVLSVLLILATSHRLGAVGPLISGHSYFVAGTSTPSNHSFGRAVDIAVVDGRPVSAGHEGARGIASSLPRLPPPLRPVEVGSPFAEFDPVPGWFSDASHRDHIHIGYGGHP